MVVRWFYLLAGGKGDGIRMQSSTYLTGGLAIAYIHSLVNYMLISLQLAKFIQLGSPHAPLVTAASAKYRAIF